jgi:hypothetical protein
MDVCIFEADRSSKRIKNCLGGVGVKGESRFFFFHHTDQRDNAAFGHITYAVDICLSNS